MDDSFLAILFALGGLGKLAFEDCPAGCLAPRQATPRWGAQAAQVLFQDEEVGGELYVTRDAGLRRGPFQPVLGASVAENGAVWAGAGLKWRVEAGAVFFESSLVPGLYAGDGPDLGSVFEVRSGAALGVELGDGSTLALTFDHRSNGDTADLNPGLETVGVRWSWVID